MEKFTQEDFETSVRQIVAPKLSEEAPKEDAQILYYQIRVERMFTGLKMLLCQVVPSIFEKRLRSYLKNKFLPEVLDEFLAKINSEGDEKYVDIQKKDRDKVLKDRYNALYCTGALRELLKGLDDIEKEDPSGRRAY
jgi:hypothetical protein